MMVLGATPRGEGAVAPRAFARSRGVGHLENPRHTLYFFNRIAACKSSTSRIPTRPSCAGHAGTARRGQEMYLARKRSRRIARTQWLLLRNGESQVLVVADTTAIRQSRRNSPSPVTFRKAARGQALYVASQTYRPVSGSTNTTWEWGHARLGIWTWRILPRPVTRGTLWYAGYANVVSATTATCSQHLGPERLGALHPCGSSTSPHPTAQWRRGVQFARPGALLTNSRSPSRTMC